MKRQIQKKRFCEKLCYGDKESPRIIYGVTLSEDTIFLIFRTSKKKYHINKSSIISIEDTTMEFREGGDD